MPELPEAEAARRLAERVAVGRRIVDLWCADDPLVFEGVSPRRFRAALLGRRVVSAHRHGKHVWLALDRRPWPCFHFGMSGGLHTPAAAGVRLMSERRARGKDAPRDHKDTRIGGRDDHGLVTGGERGSGGDDGPHVADDGRLPIRHDAAARAAENRRRAGDAGWPPRFTKLRIALEDGGELALADARRLGRVRLREDPASEPPISLLGFDALLSVPPAARIIEELRARSAPLKAVLLDQSFAAGVGNWIADEVLYQARLDPRRPARSLSPEEVRRLRAAIRHVVATAVRVGADSDRFPRTWLFHDRWGKNADARTARGEKIRHDTIGGRTTAWVPSVQK